MSDGIQIVRSEPDDDVVDVETECREIVIKLIRDLTPLLGEEWAAGLGDLLMRDIEHRLRAGTEAGG